MKRLLLTASIAALVLAACAPANEAPAGDAASGEEAGAEGTVSPESVPLPVDLGSPVFEETAEDYSIRAVVDSRIAVFQSALAENLMASAKSRLETFKADAIADGTQARERSAATGEENWFRPYSMEIRFTQSAQEGDVIGIEQFTMVDTAGAHPNYILTGLVYERASDAPVALEAVVTDMSGYGASLKKYLIEAKSERAYDDAARANVPAEVEEILGSDSEAASKFGQNFTLAPSTEAGKFGGITVLFSPYDAGPYAEGSYEITIPAAELSGKLTPDWEGRFGGEPNLPAETPQ